MGLFKSREEKLKVAIWELKDAVYYYEKWNLGDSPSERRHSLQKIAKRAAKVDSLGGDGREYLSHKTMVAMENHLV